MTTFTEEMILNPKTGRLVKRDGKIGKILLSTNKKDCPADKIRNDKTQRCVKKDGQIGKQILKRQTNRVNVVAVAPISVKPRVTRRHPVESKTILNPATNRYVLKSGKIGQRILANANASVTRVDFQYLVTNSRLLHVDSFQVFVGVDKTFLIWSENNHEKGNDDCDDLSLGYTPERLIRSMCRNNPNFLFDVYLESDELESIQKYQSNYQPLLFSQHSWILKTNLALTKMHNEPNLRVWHTDIRTRFLSSLHFLISCFVPIMFATDSTTLLRRVERILDKENVIVRDLMTRNHDLTVEKLLMKCEILIMLQKLPKIMQKIINSYFLPSIRYLALHLQIDTLFHELKQIKRASNPMKMKTMLLNENRNSSTAFFNDAVVMRLTHSLTMMMDMYTLTHAFTNNNAATVILYAGQAHVTNYIHVLRKLSCHQKFSLSVSKTQPCSIFLNELKQVIV